MALVLNTARHQYADAEYSTGGKPMEGNISEFLGSYRGFMEKSLLFFGILVPAGVCGKALLRRVVYAFDAATSSGDWAP